MTFQRIVLIIALVILMLTLVIIGVMLYNKQYNIKFPPEVGNCPDYYTSGPKNVCHNTIGVKVKNPNCNSMDFSSFSSFGNKAIKKNADGQKSAELFGMELLIEIHHFVKHI